MSFMKKILFKELDEVDFEEFGNKVEERGNFMETAFLKMQEHLPLFDFEIN